MGIRLDRRKDLDWNTLEELENVCDTYFWHEAVRQRDEYIAELEKEIEKLKSYASVEFPTSIGG